jgi:Flp pilus assembly protein TadD
MASTASPQALSPTQAISLGQALTLLQQRDAHGARSIATRLVAEAPASPDARQLLAMCHDEAGSPEQAEESFRHALRMAPDHPLLLINFAAFLRKSGRSAEALRMLGRAVGIAPDHPKAWMDLGVTALALGQAQQATVALERVLELKPGSAHAWHLLGNARRQGGDFEGALLAFNKATQLQPGSGSAWVNLGSIQRHLGRSELALASFEQASRVGHAGPELADAMVGAMLDTGRAADGLTLARKVVDEHPAFVPGLETLAHLLWEYGPALEPGADPATMFRASVRSRPQDHAMRLAFARFLLAARRADEAVEQIRILRSQEDHAALGALEADALALAGQTEPAARLYAQLHDAAFSQDPAFLNSYTRHLLAARNWDLAATLAERATQIDPHNQEAWAHLATCWRLLEDPREFWLCDYERLVTLIAIEPPAGFRSIDDFLIALRAALDPLHQAGRAPVQQSLRGGSQTPGRLFGRDDPVIAAAESSLRGAAERWLESLPPDDGHPFLRRNSGRARMAGSWSVRLWSSGNHVNHVHSKGWMSSAFYVSLPPSVRAPGAEHTRAGYLQVGQPPLELNLDLAPRRVIRPEPGCLALFPSYMWHGTVPFEDKQPRLTIAFDMTPVERRS